VKTYKRRGAWDIQRTIERPLARGNRASAGPVLTSGAKKNRCDIPQGKETMTRKAGGVKGDVMNYSFEGVKGSLETSKRGAGGGTGA